MRHLTDTPFFTGCQEKSLKEVVKTFGIRRFFVFDIIPETQRQLRGMQRTRTIHGRRLPSLQPARQIPAQ
jgi:hypothetical protein